MADPSRRGDACVAKPLVWEVGFAQPTRVAEATQCVAKPFVWEVGPAWPTRLAGATHASPLSCEAPLRALAFYGFAGYAELAGGFGFVAAAGGQHVEDVLALDVFQRGSRFC